VLLLRGGFGAGLCVYLEGEGAGVSEPTVYIDHASNPDRVVCVHPLPDQLCRLTGQGPAQRFAQTHREDARAGDGRRKSQAGNFNFG
jgi:hypothetical protein